ncbi:hypothetical protein [Nitratireductor sp. XY-223]|uniref:hypothetical protein n=1 Tax=Nitratireductor sp. XY-223 TaxID=2561926 RepID=UPI0010AB499F|nr:hypothetical protein [Nitratireductor sp. XY-223]
MDQVTEIIAHFIGVFNITVEQQRARIDYDSFVATKNNLEHEEDLPSSGHRFKENHVHKDFDPHVSYKPGSHYLETVDVPRLYDGLYLPDLPLIPVRFSHDPHFWIPPKYTFSAGHGRLEIELTPPGSVAVVAKQHAFLVDNDFITMTDIHVETMSTGIFDAQLDWLVEKAGEYDLVGSHAIPGSEEAIAEVIDGVIDNLIAAGDGAFVATGSGVQGIHVNGEAVDEMPDITDYLPQPEEVEEEETEGTTFVAGPGEFEMTSHMDAVTGGNLLVNEAAIGSSWLVAPVYAAMGDVVSLDVISQVLVWQDLDQVADGFGSPPAGKDLTTLAFNIAAFSTETTESEESSSGFPENWAVTRIDGNLVMLNWLEQITLVSDSDTSVLTSSGTETFLMTGGNAVLNTMSLQELGFYYDLIVVGGDIYSANIIDQTIVMLDSDYLTTIGEFETTSEDTVSTSDNLIWNQASIHSIGHKTYEAMPDAYAQTAANLASGDDTVTDGVLADDPFEGDSALSVLYVDGSILELNYILQKNVLGDSDQIAVLATDLAEDADTHWELETGENDVLNIASITDADIDGVVYYGGELYDDAYLHQAEFVSDEPITLEGDPDAIANEAVVFLAEGMLDPEERQDENATADEREDSADADVMQTMLA